MKTSEIKSGECHPYYEPYLLTLGEVSLVNMLRNQLTNFPEFIECIPDKKLLYAYEEGKWTILEALLHVVDTERIFQYRALRFSRGDQTSLPGFDQEVFARNSNANVRSIGSIIKEYQATRNSTITLFESFDESTLRLLGTASNAKISVGALGFLIGGHQKHHRNIIRERYL